MSNTRRVMLSIFSAVALIFATTAIAASAAHAAIQPRAVALWEASTEYEYLIHVKAGAKVIAYSGCGMGWSDVQAYRWNGRALGAQQRISRGRDLWRDPVSDKAVTYDGTRVRNHTPQGILFAVWCS